MNTLDDLRVSLESHSHDAAGLDPAARSSQLKGRIAAERRRRNAVRSGLAVAVVAAVVSVASLPALLDRDDTPSVADRTTLGEVAPASYTALGLTYEFASHTSTRTGTEVTLDPDPDADGHPSLLTWTTTEPGATVTVTESGSENVLWSSDAGSFTDHVVLDQLRGVPVTVTSSAPGVAVALYAFDEDAPIAGASSHGATFRQEVAGRQLLVGDFAELGATRLHLRYDEPTQKEISLAVHCSGEATADVAVQMRLNGKVVTSGTGCGDPRDHTGVGAYVFPVAKYLRDGRLDVEVELARSTTDDRPVTGKHPDVLLGAALYEPAQFSDFEGLLSGTTLEHSGHLWTIASDVRSQPADRISADLGTDQPHLVSGVQAGSWAFDAADDDGGPALEVDGVPLRPTGTNTSVDGLATAPTLVAPGAREVTVVPGTERSVTGTQLIVWKLVD